MQKDYWERAHKIYSKKSWINDTTIFARFAQGYFPKKGNLLDLGAGQGQDSRYFSKIGYNVISTDICDEALKLSSENAKKEYLDVKFTQLDIAEKLPFVDNSFDIVYSHLALHYFTEKKTKEIFDEIYRVLKPGGIVASLFNTIEDPELDSPQFKKIEEGYYQDPFGLSKRYFSTSYLENITKELFVPIILDNKGEAYKDEIKTLIRFIGKVRK